METVKENKNSGKARKGCPTAENHDSLSSVLMTVIHKEVFFNIEAFYDFKKSSIIMLGPLIAQSWNPGLEEVETQGENGRKWVSKRGRERASDEKCCFVWKMI